MSSSASGQIYIGVMTGSSVDAIDVAIVDFAERDSGQLLHLQQWRRWIQM